ncbi:hypothetical protein F4781DRAFT_426922 [Annulohypoxylon bovei var. microspora]|nr:hypothetical protein F4781DRAFT_426922 [Annulohypoxylon bovei var. microspora]
MSGPPTVSIGKSAIPGAGRGLFAQRDFAAGELVVCLEQPFAAELEVQHMRDTCGWCFQRGATDAAERAAAASMGLPNGLVQIQHCARCGRVGYCSRACQARAWAREHRYECPVLRPAARPDLPVGVRAVIKLLGRLRDGDAAERERILDIQEFRPAADDGHMEKLRRHDQQKFDDYNMLAYSAWAYAGKPVFEGLDVAVVSRKLLFNVMHNAFQISSPIDAAEYGIGFDPIICSANHSCDPNVVRVSNQPNTLLRAIKPIKKGDEIFMEYTSVSNPFWVRQAELKETYFFTCQCSKCRMCPVYPEDTFAKPAHELPEDLCRSADKIIKLDRKSLEKYLIGTDESRAQLRLAAMQDLAFKVAESGDATEPELRAMLKMCIESGMWAWTRQPVPQLCRRLYAAYMESQGVYKAFRLGCKLHFEIYPVLYPQPFHPERLIMAWTLSTMTSYLAGPMGAKAQSEFAEHGLDLRIVFWGLILEVRDRMPQMYGLDSPFGKVVDNYCKNARGRETQSEAEVRNEVKTTWPAFETFIKNIDIISMCDSAEGEGSGCSVM